MDHGPVEGKKSDGVHQRASWHLPAVLRRFRPRKIMRHPAKGQSV